MFSAASIICYLGAWGILIHFIKVRNQNVLPKALGVLCIGILLHIATTHQQMVRADGYQLGIFQVLSLFFLVINSLVLLSSLRKPLHNLFLFLLPLSVAAIIVASIYGQSTKHASELSAGLVVHILLSILAYSLLTIACLQALFLAYQTRQLRHKHLKGVMGLLPPLQTMETLLFELIWAGEILLTLSIITGAVFIENLLAQHLAHKTVFSILSWLIYAILLAGHYRYGWRGPAAIRWTLGGFAALMLAYFGSKLVLEVILHVSQ